MTSRWFLQEDEPCAGFAGLLRKITDVTLRAWSCRSAEGNEPPGRDSAGIAWDGNDESRPEPGRVLERR